MAIRVRPSARWLLAPGPPWRRPVVGGGSASWLFLWCPTPNSSPNFRFQIPSSGDLTGRLGRKVIDSGDRGCCPSGGAPRPLSRRGPSRRHTQSFVMPDLKSGGWFRRWWTWEEGRRGGQDVDISAWVGWCCVEYTVDLPLLHVCADEFGCWKRGIGAHAFATRDVGLRADFQLEEM